MIVPADYAVLERAVLPTHAAELARFLLGICVVCAPLAADDEICIGRIVETEAYEPGDAACHAFIGRTARNASLFSSPGFAYVYFIYGMYYCFNVSAEPEGVGGGVLIRAAQPLEGLATMRRRSGIERTRDLLRGPGRFARALGIDRSFDGIDLTSRASPLVLARSRVAAHEDARDVVASARIGLTKAVDRPLRFFYRENSFVSGTRRGNARATSEVRGA